MPSQAKKITFDTGAIFIAKAISLLLGLLRLKYIAIYLGVETFGIYTFATYFVAMFAIFFDMGLGQILTRDIAADKSRTSEYLSSALLLKVLLFVGTAIIIGAATYLSHFDAITNWAIAFSVFITGTTSLTTIFTGAFQAHRQMKLISVITIATDFFTSVAVIILLILNYGLFGLLAGSAMVSLAMFIITVLLSYKFLNFSLVYHVRRLWAYLLKEGFPVVVGVLGITLYLYATSALLKYLDGNVVAGYYNAALKIITILTVVPASFTLVIYPFFSELHVSDRGKLESVLNIAVRYMFMVSIPMAVGTIMVAKNLIATLYTSAFLPSAPALQILIISSMFGYGDYILYTFLPAINKQQFGMHITIPAGIIVAVVNYLMIPKFGLIVPSLSLAIVEMVMFAAAYLYLRKLKYSLSLTKIFLKPALSCIPMAIVVYILSRIFISKFVVLVQIPVAAVVYAASFYLMKGILEEDKLILEKVLPSPIKEKILKHI